ncbi:hypothetical protein CJ030_MR6G023577 [Morella rubra]|uniref:Uncharacterized protein n=1 Tax=Morella rubra TaxID=262757 RepID=A0A6A1VDV3_9ROSI|nr:hypothetical protein CJ030_MR6G023577 [Morella rubra]
MEDWRSDESVTRARAHHLDNSADISDNVRDTVGICRPGLGVWDHGQKAGGRHFGRSRRTVLSFRMLRFQIWMREGSGAFLKNHSTGEEKQAGLGRGLSALILGPSSVNPGQSLISQLARHRRKEVHEAESSKDLADNNIEDGPIAPSLENIERKGKRPKAWAGNAKWMGLANMGVRSSGGVMHGHKRKLANAAQERAGEAPEPLSNFAEEEAR